MSPFSPMVADLARDGDEVVDGGLSSVGCWLGGWEGMGPENLLSRAVVS